MGIFAVTHLQTSEVAVYSVLFSGWVLSQLLPSQLAYVPARFAINMSDQLIRPNVLLDMRRGLLPVLVAPILAAASALPLSGNLSAGEYASAAASVAFLTIVAPVQDYLRASLHVVGAHVSAALSSASGTLFAGIVFFCLSWLHPFSNPEIPLFVPFIVVAFANLASASVALFFLRSFPKGPYSIGSLRQRTGFLGASLVTQASTYCATLITSAVLGTAAVASLESARILASPVTVVAAGLGTYYLPAALRAFGVGDALAVRRRALQLSVVIASVGAIYASAVVVFGQSLATLLNGRGGHGLGATRSLSAALDGAEGATGSILYAARRANLWNVVVLGTCAVALAVLVPALLIFGPIGFPIALGIGFTAKAVIGLCLVWRTSDQTAR